MSSPNPKKRPASALDEFPAIPGQLPATPEHIHSEQPPIAPHTVNIFVRIFLLLATWLFSDRTAHYLQRYEIQPEPVHHDNGARKRIALDITELPPTPSWQSSNTLPGSWYGIPTENVRPFPAKLLSPIVPDAASCEPDHFARVARRVLLNTDELMVDSEGPLFHDSFKAALFASSNRPAVDTANKQNLDNGRDTTPTPAASPQTPLVARTIQRATSVFGRALRRKSVPHTTPITSPKPVETPLQRKLPPVVTPYIRKAPEDASESPDFKVITASPNLFVPTPAVKVEPAGDSAHEHHQDLASLRIILPASPLEAQDKSPAAGRALSTRRVNSPNLSPEGRGKWAQIHKQRAQPRDSSRSSEAQQLRLGLNPRYAREANAKRKADHAARAAKFAEQAKSTPPAVKRHASTNESSLLDASASSTKKAVSWGEENRVKNFNKDKRVTEMQDESETLDMRSPAPGDGLEHPRDTWRQADSSADSTDDESTDGEGSSWRDGNIDHFQRRNSSASRDDKTHEASNVSENVVGEVVEHFESKLNIERSETSVPTVEPVPESETVVEREPVGHTSDVVQQFIVPPAAVKPLIAPLTEDELEVLQNATKSFCDAGKRPDVVVAQSTAARYSLMAKDFGTLLPAMFNGDPKAWLNDDIINFYLQVLVKHQQESEGYILKKDPKASPPPVHAFSSGWLNTARSNPKSLVRWARVVNLSEGRLLKARVILLPFEAEAHWRLITIKPQDRLIEYHDSLGWTAPQYIKAAHILLEHVLGELYVESEWTVEKQQKSVRQKNGSDCGVFTALNGLVCLRGEEHQRVVSICGMEDARRRIAITLLTGKPTGELD